MLNGCHERRFTDEDEAEVLRLTAEGAGRRARARRAARRRRCARRAARSGGASSPASTRRACGAALDAPLVSLPFLFREALGLEDVRLLAGRLEAA